MSIYLIDGELIQVEKIMKDWKHESGVQDEIMYRMIDVWDYERSIYLPHELTVITTKPGIMIGLHGNLVNKYKEKLRCEVNFIDISWYDRV